MSYAVKRAELPGPASADADAAPPATATVVDFACLFTHDLRRKQKRWQDGRLRYHTFNRRVMVYDDRGSLVGDAHWQAGPGLDEGDEFPLDRGAAIVQVADRTGEREQDLSEIFDKRAREVEKRRAAAAARSTSAPGSSGARGAAGARPDTARPQQQQQQQQQHFQLLHRPLTSIVASPGAIGRSAVPTISPYEKRQGEQRAAAAGQEGVADAPPPAKRRKRSVSPPSKSGYARSLFGATLSLSGGPMSSAPMARGRALRDTTNVRQGHATHADEGVAGDDKNPDSTGNVHSKQTTHARNTRISNDEDQRAPRAHTKQTACKASGTENDEGPDVVLLESRHRRPDTSGDRCAPTPGQGPLQAETLPSTPPTNCGVDMTGVPRGSHIGDGRQGETFHAHEDTPPILARGTTGRPGAHQPGRKPEPAGKRASSDASGTSASPGPGEPVQPKRGSDPSPASKTACPTRIGTVAQAGGVEDGLPQQSVAQPRTALRIRARQRRGLLMISEKNDGPAARGSGSGVDADAGGDPPEPDIGSSDPSDSETCQARTTPNRRGSRDGGRQPLRNPRRQGGRRRDPDVDAAKSKPRAVSRDCLSRSPTGRLSDHNDDRSSAENKGSDSDDQWLGRAGRGKREEETTGASGPRISRMARKSVKSKEIFGFSVSDAGDLVPGPMAAATGRLGDDGQQPPPPSEEDPGRSAPAAAEVGTGDAITMQAPAADVGGGRQRSVDNVVERGATAPRLANPASRGRKAATREDAAGQMPRIMVHMEPAAPTRRDEVGGEPPRSCPVKEEGEKSQAVAYPGFTSARAGTWSRHAEDLLGMRRPERKKPRR